MPKLGAKPVPDVIIPMLLANYLVYTQPNLSFLFKIKTETKEMDIKIDAKKSIMIRSKYFTQLHFHQFQLLFSFQRYPKQHVYDPVFCSILQFHLQSL